MVPISNQYIQSIYVICPNVSKVSVSAVSISIKNMYSVLSVQIISGINIVPSIRYLIFTISESGNIPITCMISGIDQNKYFKLFTTSKIG